MVPVTSHPHHHLVSSTFLILAILVFVKWYCIVALIFISLLINKIEYLFMCALPSVISSLVKCLFKSFAYFLLSFLSHFWLYISLRILNTSQIICFNTFTMVNMQIISYPLLLQTMRQKIIIITLFIYQFTYMGVRLYGKFIEVELMDQKLFASAM